MIVVAKDGSGNFSSIQEAVDSITMLPETIYVKKGTYEEIVDVRMPYLTIEGEDASCTVIKYGNYANMIMDDGSKRGTFRSYTMIVTGDNVTLKNLTIMNDSGFGKEVGQAIALYAECDKFKAVNCKILGHQDTLFTGPLPLGEAKKGGFVGPTEFAERRFVKQVYDNCYIEGEVDFIFGSAAAYFDKCIVKSLNRNMDVNGYVTAPSTYKNQKYGYVFNECKLISDCMDDTVYLGRPWRENAKCVFINCDLSGHIKKEGFHDWNKEAAHTLSFFGEYNCTGDGSDTSKRADFVKQLSNEQAKDYTLEAFLQYSGN